MKVFVVNFGYSYQGESTRGVYSTLERARIAVAAGDVDKDCDVMIWEMEMDAPLNSPALEHAER